jgi:acyl-CoA-binding protein
MTIIIMRRTKEANDFQQKKATHKRWQEWADKGTSQQDAEQKYVALAQELISKHS